MYACMHVYPNWTRQKTKSRVVAVKYNCVLHCTGKGLLCVMKYSLLQEEVQDAPIEAEAPANESAPSIIVPNDLEENADDSTGKHLLCFNLCKTVYACVWIW